MKMTSVDKIREEMEFAELAAKEFAKDKKLSTFSLSDVEPGSFFAVRWGLGDDCVLVLKLCDVHEPTIYQQLIKEA